MKKLMNPQKNEEVFEKTYKKVLNFLSFKDRTSFELSTAVDKYLLKVSLSKPEKEVIKDQVMEEVNSLGLINDRSYVKNYILDVLQADRLISKKQIENFLYRKGISREVTDHYLGKYYTQDVEEEIVSKLFEKRSQKAANYSGFEEKSKMTKYLLSKGFSPSVVYTVVDTKTKR